MNLLLHMCCAPCSVYPVNELIKNNINFTGIFYNPNIHPIEEFEKRKENVEILSKVKGFPVIYNDEYRLDTWKSIKADNLNRCKMCYSIRLEETARYAKENSFDYFTTSLLISPYQDHDLIKNLGEEIAEKYGVKFFYKDYRPKFREGQKMSGDMGLYKQKFCGCIYSYYESDYKKKPDYIFEE